MTILRLAMIGLIGPLISGIPSARGQEPTNAAPTPPAPGKSLPAQGVSDRISRSFPADGIRQVILRAESARAVKVRVVLGSRVVRVSGRPAGDAKGYHPADPDWKETPASQWGLDFAARKYGSTLVISSEKEVLYIHHYYHLEDLIIEIPPDVAVVKQDRHLTGEQTPDLSDPAARKG